MFKSEEKEVDINNQKINKMYYKLYKKIFLLV